MPRRASNDHDPSHARSSDTISVPRAFLQRTLRLAQGAHKRLHARETAEISRLIEEALNTGRPPS